MVIAPWTDDERATAQRLHGRAPDKQLRKAMGRTPAAIRAMALRQGPPGPDETLVRGADGVYTPRKRLPG